jgi:hypothetical protein
MHTERFWFCIHSKILIQTLNFIFAKIDMQLICNTNLAWNSNKRRFKVWLGRRADNAPWFQMNSQPLINVDITWTYDVTLTLDNSRFIEIEVFMTTLFRRRKNYVSICMHSQPWIYVETTSDDDVVSTFNDWHWIDVCIVTLFRRRKNYVVSICIVNLESTSIQRSPQRRFNIVSTSFCPVGCTSYCTFLN